MGTRAVALYTLHGLIMMDPGLAKWKRAMYLAIERILSLRTKRIIAVSPEESRAAVDVGLGNSRVVVVPNGVDEVATVPREQAREELRLPPGAVAVGFIGRLVEQKAVDVLLKAFAQAAQDAPRLQLVVVGDGPLMHPLCELAANLDIAHRVIWLGERDARQVISAFDVFAISSRKEGLPYVVLEAMSAGLPIVATSSSGVEILVEPGVNGLVVPPDNVEGFADALALLANSPEVRGRCAAASLRMISRFSIDAMVENSLAVYRSALPSHRAAAAAADADAGAGRRETLFEEPTVELSSELT